MRRPYRKCSFVRRGDLTRGQDDLDRSFANSVRVKIWCQGHDANELRGQQMIELMNKSVESQLSFANAEFHEEEK
jgi:hypothetical protein